MVLLSILGLAIVDSINPSAIAVTLYLVTKKKFTAQVLAYVLGIFCTYLTIGVLLTLGLSSLLGIFGEIFKSEAAYWVQLVVGVMLLAYAVFGNPFASKQPKPERRPSSQKLSALFMLGVGISVVEFATALPYLAAIGILIQLDIALIFKVFILLGYNIVMVLPPLLLLVAARFGAERWQAKFEWLRQKVAKGAQEALYWLFGIVGLFLIAQAVKYFGWIGG